MSEPAAEWATRTSEQDQAAGLRRLLRSGLHRTVGVLASGPGLPGSALSETLALEVMRRGDDVVLVGGVGQTESAIASARVAPASGRRHVRFVPLTVADHRGGAVDPGRLATRFDALRQGGELVLIEVPGDRIEIALAAQDLVFACGAHPAALTSGYRLLKRIAQIGARARTHVLVCGAHTEDRAGRVFANLSDTAGRFLALRLDYVGHLRDSAHLLEAVRLQQPVSALYPESPCSVLLARCMSALFDARADR